MRRRYSQRYGPNIGPNRTFAGETSDRPHVGLCACCMELASRDVHMASGLVSMLRVSRIWFRLSWLASVLMALASAAGVFVPTVYAKETPSWRAQAVGQDMINLALV